MSSLIYLKNPNGKTYVYENVTYWDKETKTSKHKRKCVGHLDPETNEITPNRKKGDASKSKKMNTDIQNECTVTGCGISLLLDKVASQISLDKALKSSFPEDWKHILTCAYFLVSEGNALCHLEKWSATNNSPSETILSSQRISELLLRITPSLQQSFFKSWVQKHQNDEYYALDITSISSYSEAIDFVRYGYNRDHENLPQINMMMITGEHSRLPIFYQLLPGSIKDVSTLQSTLKNLSAIESKKLHVVMDKGFYSETNIDSLYAHHTKFIVGVPFTSSIAKNAVIENRANMDSHRNYCNVFGDELYATSKLTKWGGHRCYVHTYYDSLKAERELKKFNHMILMCHDELVRGEIIESHSSYYEKYFVITNTPKRGKKVEYNEEAIQKHRINHTGWFVMISNDVKDPKSALEIYRRKDVVEKSFDDLKNDLDLKRLRIHSTNAMDGRIFLQYIALILSSQIKVIMNDADWYKNHDMQKVIDEMKSMRKVKISGKRKELTSTLTNFQREIVELFNLKV